MPKPIPTEVEVKQAIQKALEGHALAVQCLYIVSNITSWRNPEADCYFNHLISLSLRED